MRGRVAWAGGDIADGVCVAIVDADPECDDLLGVGVTNAAGLFRFTFTTEAFNQEAGEAEESPDLYVVASVDHEGARVPILRRDFPGLRWDAEEDLGTITLPLARGARPTAVPGLRATPGATKLVRRISLDPEIVDVAAHEVVRLIEHYTGWTRLLDDVRLTIVDDGFVAMERARVAELLGKKELDAAALKLAEDGARGCDATSLARWEPDHRTVYLNRTTLEAQNYDALRVVLGHELVHVGQSKAHPEVDAELHRIHAEGLAHELAGTAYSTERAQEIARFMANIEGYAEYVEQRLRAFYTHGTTIWGARLSARSAVARRHARSARSAFIPSDGGGDLKELLHLSTMTKETQYQAGLAAYAAKPKEGELASFDPAFRPELHFAAGTVELLETLANAGDPATQLQLGLVYLEGRGGVPKDVEKAKHWFRLAAAHGVFAAAFLVAALLPIDDPERVGLVRPAAEQGMAEAQYLLGVTLLRDGAPDVEKKEGIAMLEKAAAQGLAGAMTDLGIAYEKGIGVPRDVVMGRVWRRRAEAAERAAPTKT